MRCSSSLVPSVTVTSACVSPRVKSAEPWVRGSTPASPQMARTSSKAAAIRTAVRVQHLVAEDPLLQSVEELAGFDLLLFRRFFDHAIVQRVDAGVAFELFVLLRIQRVGQFRADLLLDRRRRAPALTSGA